MANAQFVVYSGQFQADCAGVGVRFAVAGYEADERALILASVGVIVGRRSAHREVRPVLSRAIQADHDVGGLCAKPDLSRAGDEHDESNHPHWFKKPMIAGYNQGAFNQGKTVPAAV